MIPYQSNSLICFLSEQSGVPKDQIYSIFCVLSSIPLSLFMYLISNPTLRLYYSLICGVFLQFLVYEVNIIHLFIATLFTYTFVKFFGRKYSAFFVLSFTMIYLASMHLYRMITSYEVWDIRDPTGIYMLSMCKFSFFAFSYEDGEKDDKDIYNAHHRRNKIVKLPSFTEFFAYIYFFPTATYGPSIEYVDFIDFIYLNKHYKKMDKTKNIKLGILRVIIAFIIIGLYGAFNSKFATEFIGTKEFGASPFIYKFMYVNLSSWFTKAKYYGGWTLTYGILMILGVSYTEDEKGNSSYDIGYIGSIVTVETSSNPKNIIIQWNHPCHLWLKYSLFLRLINVKKFGLNKNIHLCSLITFVTSAIWHGFYPCYYFFFISFYFIQQASETLNKIGFYNWLSKQNVFVRGFACVVIQYMINGIAIIFFAMKWTVIKGYLINMMGLPLIMVMTLYVISIIAMKSTKMTKKD